MRCAYESVRANKGAPGIDGMTFWQVEHDEEGDEGFLGGIRRELKDEGRPALLYTLLPKKGQRFLV